MKLEEFIELVTELMEERLGDGYTIKTQKVLKNNDVNLTGMSVYRKDGNIAPTFYLDYFYELYENGASLDSILGKLMDLFKESIPQEDLDLDFFLNFELASQRIAYKLVNYKKNKQLLEKVPHRKYLDLAIVYFYYMKDDSLGNASILIYNNHMNQWNTTEEELYEKAKVNTPKLLQSNVMNICEAVEGLKVLTEAEEYKDCSRDVYKDLFDMYVVTNEERFYGATCLLYDHVLKDFSEKKNCGFYILPSSIHEIILLPENMGGEPEDLVKMVREVNSTQLEDQEILSDGVYFYSREKDEVISVG